MSLILTRGRWREKSERKGVKNPRRGRGGQGKEVETKIPPPARQHWGRDRQTFAEFTELQTVHCWAAGRWDQLCTRICNAVQNCLVGCCSGFYFGHVRDNAVKNSDVINLGRFDFVHPICCSAVRRGRIVSVRLLRSPVSSDCAFIHSRNMDAPCPVVTPSPAGAWLGVIYHNQVYHVMRKNQERNERVGQR